MFRHQSKETIVKEQIRQSSDGADDVNVPFIDIIICPDYDLVFKKEALEHYNLDKSKYRSKGEFIPSLNSSERLDLYEVFENITQSVTDLLYRIKFTTLSRQQRSFTEDFNQPKDQTEHLNIVTKHQNSLGRCYSVRPKAHVLRLGVLRVEITARMDVYVYLGYPGQFMYNTKTKVLFTVTIQF